MPGVMSGGIDGIHAGVGARIRSGHAGVMSGGIDGIHAGVGARIRCGDTAPGDAHVRSWTVRRRVARQEVGFAVAVPARGGATEHQGPEKSGQ
jgi:hypothetical protein